MAFFCDYYRRLGVNHFLFIDNGSTDGFVDWARTQDDISVWYTEASYKKSRFGMDWCNRLLSKYGSGHLCVTVDPDEFLVYPHMDSRNLHELGQHLKDTERDSMCALMLDAYSDRPLSETVMADGEDPFTVCPYFDRDGYIQTQSHLLGIFVQGGPRMRMHNPDRPSAAPALNKIPVMWWKWYYSYRSSMHDAWPLKLNRPHNPGKVAVTACLFHFKFVASLQEKAAEEMTRREHYAGGREYERYNAQDREILYEEGISVRYESPAQLVKLGLMTPGEWF